jgi:predicted nucleotidyltransferase
MEKDENLEIIKKIANEAIPGCRVLLFGSRARNTNQEQSDYDIIIVINQEWTPNQKMPYRTAIREKLSKFHIYADVLVQSENEIKVKSKLIGHVIRSAMKDAIAL